MIKTKLIKQITQHKWAHKLPSFASGSTIRLCVVILQEGDK